jgi:hypothetical protein
MESINSFVKGMNSDVSNQIHTPDSYLQALNFRGVGNLGDSNGSLVNIKGNDHTISFPILRNTYKLIIDPVLTGSKSTSGIVTITINGQTTAPINVSAGSVGLDIYNALKNLPNCFETTGTPSVAQFAVSYLDNYVVVYQQPVYTLTTAIPASLLMSINLSNPTVATTTISFVDFANVTSNTQSVYLPSASNSILIGSGYIDDDIYLLTAVDNDTEANPHPNDSFSNLGTIWKLSIDEITKVSTLTLIYNNNLDFTKYHPVPPSAIVGRYESNGIQRIYWSDFYNAIRTIVVSDPQLMALDPTQISVFPAVSFEIPLLKEITTGSLLRGSYEACYRLKKTTGAISNYSQTSNIVNLQGDESNPYAVGFLSYECNGGIIDSGRGIRWNVWNVDTSWDTIEFFVLYRESKTALPIIYVIPSETIPTGTPYLFEFTTITDLETISVEEYLTLSSGFTHAKTCETKDNILFWGNTKLVKQKQITEVFDSRAFRAHSPNTQDIILKNNGVFDTYTLSAAADTPHTNDSINQYYTSTGDIDTVHECYYKPGTSVLGGAGKYISYEFGTENILLTDLAVTKGGDWFINTVASADPPYSYRTIGIQQVFNPTDLIEGTTDSDNQTYPVSGVGTAKNPYFTSLLKGFQQEEIYRFGIQFFDLQGVPYFTEWIGDIKMPSYGDTCNNLTELEILAGVTDFRNSFYHFEQVYGRTLYVKFTVDVTAVANLISGYQIVRVERDKNNRTMLGYGMLTNVYKDLVNGAANIGGGMHKTTAVYFDNVGTVLQYGHPYSPWPDQDSVESLGQSTVNNDADVSDRMLTFDCFDYMTGEFGFQAGDKMLVRSRVNPINFKNSSITSRYRTGFFELSDYLTNSAVANTQPSLINPVFSGGRFKTGYDAVESPIYILFYIDDETYGRLRPDVNKIISKGLYCAAGSSLTSGETSIVDFNNYMMEFGSEGGPSHPGQGTATMLTTYNTTDQIRSIDFGASAGNGKKLMALYYRPNAKQYGGNTYSNRAGNEYIACGSFIPLVRKNNLLINNKIVTAKVFGGDVFINNWDLQKMIKDSTGTTYNHYNNSPTSSSNVGSVTGIPMVSSEMKMSNMFYIPCTNVNNQAVRGGYHFDKHLINGGYTYPDYIDEYLYDSFHSSEKTTTKFIPKPVEFIVNDEWRNRIYFSNPKYDNETSDSWSAYPINQFYDVEGNYGGITSLISLNQTVYFIQERGFGMLMINPVSMVSDTTTGAPIKLGSSTTVIQKHFYKALDIGTKHQWSVYRSQNSIAFTDTRQKKIFIFNGESLNPASDSKGQRNFMFKRLHDNILNHDNPIIGKGLLTTFDYQNNEFLFTFKNNNTIPDPSKDENYTISYSEYLDAFVSMYSFTPNIYVNNNTNLLSVVNNNPRKLYLHNNGEYSKFYGKVYPSTLKFLVNNNPTYTKVFDNLTITTEAIDDRIEWSDDLNVYPGAITLPIYPDNVNIKDSTFDYARFYNQYQNTDWIVLDPNVGGNIRKVEQGFNLQIPRNKFNYDLYPVSTSSLFDPYKLTKTSFGDRLRDKWMNVDLSYNNLLGIRFIVHNVKALFRISDR